VARILQERLQKVAEEELPESQCGFRKCTDMILAGGEFMGTQCQVFFTFIDLRRHMTLCLEM
jgi:hypothetical protein